MEIITIQKEDLREMIKETIRDVIGNNPKPQVKKYHYGMKGLAEIIGCSLVTAQKWKDSGLVPYTQAGRKLVFEENEVLNALRCNK